MLVNIEAKAKGPKDQRVKIAEAEKQIDSNMSGPPIRHDVFLSFRGEDTRYNFISHLYAELDRKNIQTFIDYRLDRGEDISPALLTAIQESMIYVIVFSQDYASSTWCLEELTNILECKKRYRRHVIPVFYKVDPSSVRNQRERYAEAFVKHELRFKDNMDKVYAWKAALTEASGLSGWASQVNRPESTFVVEIVKDILRKLNRSSTSDHQGIIGIDNHIARIQSLLQLESPAIRIIGIWGMGGIGKTTIASQIYHKMAVQFNSSTVVIDGEKEIERHGIQQVRRKYLSELLDFSNERLKRTKVLLILDDMNNSRQLEDLIGGRGNFGPGSRIIVTSRDLHVLKNAKADEIYQVKEMNFQHSLKLFSLHAFKQNHPRETYMDLSVKVLNYAKGIPLALKVLGSFLHDRTKLAWESELQKLEKLPNLEIFNILKVSYDGLDDEQKAIFLDIACFYRGHEENVVAQTLCSSGFYANIGMDVLKDRCLISVLEGRIVMHDLITEMGQEIVRQECVNDPRKRSRLWKVGEIYHVLRKNKGTDVIQCILLDICKIRKVELHAETFKKMDNLRMLQFYKSSKYREESNVLLLSSLESLPDALKILRWDCFPQTSLPLNFCPENLVTLEMQHSHLEQLWEPDQYLPNLKRLDLSFSGKLIRIQDLYLSPNIEEIILSHCRSLIEVCSSGILNKLKCLCLNGCAELRRLTISSNILSRSSGLIFLSNCRKLETFSISNRSELVQRGIRQPDTRSLDRGKGWLRWYFTKFYGSMHANAQRFVPYSPDTFDPVVNIDGYKEGEENNMDLLKLKVMRLRAGVEGVSSIFPSPNELCWLDLSDCESLTTLPLTFDISKLKFLKRLLLGGCSNLEYFPEIEDTLENLAVLNLDRTAIQELPSSLGRLVGLEELSLHSCTSLEIIPSSIGNLSKLCKLGLAYCESLQTLPSTIFKLKLTKLDLHGCSMLRTFPEILEPAETFAHINLTKTAIQELPQSFGNLVWLRTLRLNECTHLQSLPNSIVNLNHLSVLDCSGCSKLTEIPSDICCLSLLRELSLNESQIVNLPENIVLLLNLKSLDISDCKSLVCIPQLPPFLKQLLAFDCPSITRVMSNSLIQIPSNAKEGAFKFHFTNSQQLYPSARVNIADDAKLKMTDDTYSSVFFCFPGSAVPHWFPFHGEGHSLTINTDSLTVRSDDRLIGFALCAVFQVLDTNDVGGRYGSFIYNLKFESDDGMHILLNEDELRNHFYWKGRERIVDQDHTFLWKYNLEPTSMSLIKSFTFEISQYVQSIVTVKECGIRPLYAKEKDNNVGASDYSGFLGFSEIDIGESSGSKVA